jgi:dephospho-CoA kinase
VVRVGLTGGIASGKSVVAELFAALGAPIVDTDQVARDVVAPGEPGLAAVAKAFGRAILTPAGTLDRAALRRRVFADEKARERLEAILHPLIRARTLAALDNMDAPYVLVAVPLLVETGFAALVDRVLVVDCPREIQLARLMARDQHSRAEAEQILAAQVSRETRLAAADDVIDNGSSLAATRAQVATLHQRYLELAAELP